MTAIDAFKIRQFAITQTLKLLEEILDEDKEHKLSPLWYISDDALQSWLTARADALYKTIMMFYTDSSP